MDRSVKILYRHVAARGVTAECSGASSHLDAAAAGLDLEGAFAFGNTNAAARGIAIQRTAQPVELQPAPAGVCLCVAREVAHANSATRGFELRVELGRYGDRVSSFRALPALPGPAV